MDELVTQAMAGSREAFGRIVEREQAKVRAYIACRMPCPDDAEDLAQETFVIAYRRLDTFQQTGEIWPWLRGIARNLVLNARRKLSHREQLFEGILDEVPESVQEQTPSDSLIFVALSSCVAKLSDKMREFVRLRYSVGQSLSEIAAKLGLTAGSVRVTHVRLLKSLRKCVWETVALEGRA